MLNKLRLLLEAFAVIVWAQVVVRVRSFTGAVPPYSGRCVKNPYFETPTPGRLARAVRVASNAVPLTTCLVKAVAAQRLLARYGHASTLHIGVARTAECGFQAHAWVECDGKTVIGNSDVAYTPLIDWGVA